MMKGFLIWTILLVSPLVSTVTAQWKFDQNELKIRETKFFFKEKFISKLYAGTGPKQLKLYVNYFVVVEYF